MIPDVEERSTEISDTMDVVAGLAIELSDFVDMVCGDSFSIMLGNIDGTAA